MVIVITCEGIHSNNPPVFSTATNGDGIEDATGLVNGTDPNLVDSDVDSFVDGEQDLGTKPTLADSDGDQLPDDIIDLSDALLLEKLILGLP